MKENIFCPKLAAVCKTSDSIFDKKIRHLQVHDSYMDLAVTSGKNLDIPSCTFFPEKMMVSISNFN